jgi:hypothetical protein
VFAAIERHKPEAEQLRVQEIGEFGVQKKEHVTHSAFSRPRPCNIKIARPDDPPILIRDSAQAHAKGLKTKPGALGAVVESVMVVAMKGLAHAHGTGQLVKGCEAVRVCAGCFMGDKDVCAQF